MTKIGKTLAAGLTICSAMLLTGCGGGGSIGVSADVTIPVTQAPAFDIGAQLNGLPIGNFDVEPGDNQTITVPAGATFELDSNTSVYWSVYVAGNLINGGTNSITFEDATLTESLVNGIQFAGYATSQGPLAGPVPFTLIATSKIDGSQTAQINIVVTN